MTLVSKSLNSHKWSYYDLEYGFIAAVFIIDFLIIQSPNLLYKSLIAGAFVASFFIPYIRRFTISALPIFTWLITFYACQFIPIEYRPDHIFVNLLPTLERILYGANLSEIISKHTHPVLDILAWIPYGIIHFSFPFILSMLLFVYGPPGSLKVFAKAFGYMNLAGVLTQLFFPNASPWYEIIYGSTPADYSIPGEAGGLNRIDDILGLELYGSTFGTSPLVFGAFPSLHSGCASMEMLFVGYFFPKMRPVAIIYVLWMWFATMYLTHHYMIDLVGGSIYAISFFVVAQQSLPKINPDKSSRLEYLGITKYSIWSFIQSIEHDSGNYSLLPLVALIGNDDNEISVKPESQSTNQRDSEDEDALLMNPYYSNNLQPLQIREMIEEDELSSPGGSVGYWSPVSEPSSPITPRSPLSSQSSQLSFNKPE